MEDSTNDTEPRCACGFWGSPQTLGLCSVCYRKVRRNQSHSQATFLTSDPNKPGGAHCPSQAQHQNTSQGVRMDSRHFPSRSTTDNLPSSLSSPPGERGALSTAVTSTPASTSCSNVTTVAASSHLCNTSDIATTTVGGNANIAGVSGGEGKTQTQNITPSPSDTDTCSSASSDLSYDPKRDAALLCPSPTSVDSYSSSHVSQSDSVAAVGSSSNVVPSTGDLTATETTDGSASSTTQPCIPTTAVTTVASGSTKAPTSAATSTKNISDMSSSTVSPAQRPSTSLEAHIQPAPSIQSPAERGTKRSHDEMEASSAKSSPAPSPQKNKKRCFVCSCKLELAQRTIGRCRCGNIFCGLHRLPELHDCVFNHKEDGRREAREKMVKPTRHLGPSYRREDKS